LKVPDLVKTRIEKIVPEIRSSLGGLLRTGYKKDLESDSARYISVPDRETPVSDGKISGSVECLSESISKKKLTSSAIADKTKPEEKAVSRNPDNMFSIEEVPAEEKKHENKTREAEVANKENAQPVQYIITWGDTLWKIAKRFYGEPRLFPSIAKKNSIPNPDRILAGDTIQIPPRTVDSEKIDKEDEDVSK